jgi:hypothetical protein
MNDERDGNEGGEAERSWTRRFGTGVETILGEGRIRNLLAELKLPREIVNHILAQVDETKQAAIKAIARETREFLEHTNLADELARLLTQVSLQVELRFVPNEKAMRKAREEAAAAGPDLSPGSGAGTADAGSAGRSPRSGPPAKTGRRRG